MTESRRHANIVAARAMLHLGVIYKVPFEAVAQLVENEADAHAKQIWVVLTDKTLEVVGNGQGMVPYILPEDRQVLTDFQELAELGDVSVGYDVRREMSKTSLQSLEWMMERIAHSSKLPGEEEEVRGMRGIGSLAYFSYARAATYYTKPNAALERAHFVDEAGKYDKGKTWQLDPPTREQLDRLDTSYTVKASRHKLTDPWGKTLRNGTHVVVSDFLPGMQADVQRVPLLMSYLVRRFGEDVRSGRYVLNVVDRTGTKEKTYSVRPLEYKGYPVLNQTASVEGVPYDIELYFNPRATENAIQVRRKGSGVFDLTDLPEFKGSPWDKLSGFVAFPDFGARDEAMWDSSKTTLRNTEQYHEWIRQITALVPHIEEQIHRLVQSERESELRSIGEELSHALQEAMRQLPQFDELLTSHNHHKGKRRTETTNKVVLEDVRARVLNEHNQSVPHVKIRLLSVSGDLIAWKMTGKSGSVTFGKQSRGSYSLEMVPPKNTEPISEVVHHFKLDSEHRGFREVFRIKTGAEAPPQIDPSNIRFSFLPFEDPLRPWRQRLTVGNIDINTDAPDFKMAMTEGDDETLAVLLSQYSAAALCEYSLGGLETGDVLLQESMLFPKILQSFRGRLSGKKRTHKRKR